ncbi:MAG: murein biosynthesis integral membrane protein MurJ [Patescibacteria group bacterium]
MRSGIILLGFSFLISKVLGLLRDNMLAAQFGVGVNRAAVSAIHNLDIYYAAFRLPDLLFNLLSYGVLSAAFVPLFVEVLKKDGRDSAFKFANEIMHAICGIIIGISVLMFIFTPQIVRIFVPGFGAEEFAVTVGLTRIMLITPIFFTIGSIAGGIQNAFHKFLGLSLAPIFYNIGIIGGILFLSKDYGVYGVAIGVSIGAALNMLIQLPGILRAGFRFMIPRVIWSNRIKEMIMLSLPRIFGMSVTQLSLIVDTFIASGLTAGSITIINFATNLETLPMGLIGISVAIVSFGTLSAYAAEQKISEFIKEIFNNTRRILFLLIPLTFGMLALRIQIVRLLLGRGKFDWSDTILTANTMGFLLSGLAFGGLVFLLARAFYAMKNTRTPVIISCIAVVSNIVGSVVLTKIFHLETYGLAIANATANIINATLLIVFLSKRLNAAILDWKEIFKFIIGALVMVLAVQLAKSSFGYIFREIDTYPELIVQTVSSILVGVFVYFGACWTLKCKDSIFKP